MTKFSILTDSCGTCLRRAMRKNSAASQLKLMLLTLVALLFVGGSVTAQDDETVRVVEVLWGFDGRVVAGQFMPLSILVDNLSDQPIEATARLRCVSGMVNEVGGIAVQPVFLGPNSRRWVQFYPYLTDRNAMWYFDLQTEDDRFTFPEMSQPRAIFDRYRSENEEKQSLPAVILDPPGMVTRAPTTIKHMPEEIFPPYGTAMNGLYSLFMDHVPDWEAPRQEALLSWLKCGGRLYLLQDSNNQTLRFSGVLAALNEPFPEFTVGQGTVTRYDVQRSGLQIQMVTPAVTPSYLTERDADPVADFNQRPQNTRGSAESVDDDEMFSWLRELTQPDHSWPLIALLSLCYVGLIFPGCWLLSKKRTLHFLVTYGVIAGLALVFSLLFLVIGRRGYGESTSLHSLAVARCEDDTHWNSLQYNTLFVTGGDRYRIEEKNRQTLIGSGALDERVEAVSTSGNSASYVSRIPPFSSQAVMCRRRLTLDSWDLAIANIAQNGQDLTQLTMTFNDKFPVGSDVQYFIMHGKRIHTAKLSESSKQLSLANISESLQTFCTGEQEINDNLMLTPWGATRRTDRVEDPVQECYRKSLPKMVQRSLADDFVEDIRLFQLPPGKIRLLVYAPIPVSAELPVDTEANRGGRILYVREMDMQAVPAP